MVRRWLLALALTTVVVVLCILYVDRPVATWVHEHLANGALSRAAVAFLRPMPLAAVVALALLLVHGLRMAAGQVPASWTRTPVLGSWAMAWGLAAAVVLKRMVGRSDAYPGWVLDGVHTFRPLHGHEHFEAFPSGTMCVATALAAVLWIRMSSLRPLWAAGVLLLIALLIVTNSHWVADAIAGTFIGATVGWLTTAMMGHEQNA